MCIWKPKNSDENANRYGEIRIGMYRYVLD